MTSRVDINACADELAAARSDGRTIPPFTQRGHGFALADGYAVMAELNRRAEEAGRLPWGWKAGLTDAVMRERMRIDEPIWGVLWQDTVTHATTVTVGGLVQPRIEAEIVFGLADGRLAVDAIEWVAPAFEIVQCHYQGWQMAAPDAVADFCLHEALVVGERVPAAEVDRRLMATIGGQMRRNNDEPLPGSGANVMGDPLAVLTWMGSTEADHAVPTGQLVTTGALAGVQPLSAGDRWHVAFDGDVLPSLSLSLE